VTSRRPGGDEALLCSCLSAGHRRQELDVSSAAALTDPAADLVGFARLAGRHLVTPMVAACVASSPAAARRMPEDFRRYLALIHAENARRNRRLRLQLGEIARRLNAINIEPLVLKGAIRLVDGLYPDLGWRFMRDIDLLVPPDRLGDAVACLLASGYRFRDVTAARPAEHRHLPQLQRDDHDAVVELHAELLPGRVQLCAALDVMARSRPVDIDGARGRIPDVADQLAHLIAHDRYDEQLRQDGRFLLRSAFETALLCSDESPVRRLLERFSKAGVGHWAWGHVQRCDRLFPGYVSLTPDAARAKSLRTRVLVAAARCDEAGALRRVCWFARSRAVELRRSPTARRRLMANALSADYRRRSFARLRELWVDG
jgi:Uncharacterised nucleotidyltransferase